MADTVVSMAPIITNMKRHKGGLHLYGARQGHPLKSDLPLDYIWESHNKVIVRPLPTDTMVFQGFYPGARGSMASLITTDGPAVLGTFTWSQAQEDGCDNQDLSTFFTTAVIRGDGSRVCPYTTWRIRGFAYIGYAESLYSGNSRAIELVVLEDDGDTFTQVTGGWALGLSHSLGNVINSNFIYTGGDKSIFYKINYQIEVGYNHSPLSLIYDERGFAFNQEASAIYPAYTQAITTDHGQWRSNPDWYPYHP